MCLLLFGIIFCVFSKNPPSDWPMCFHEVFSATTSGVYRGSYDTLSGVYRRHI